MGSFSASVTRGGNFKRIPVVLSIKQMLISFEVPPWPAARVRVHSSVPQPQPLLCSRTTCSP